MDNVVFSPTNDSITSLEKLYTYFDLTAAGFPTVQWEGRQLRDYSLKRRLRWFYAPEVYLSKIRVNRRMADPLAKILDEINERWDPKQAEKENLDVFTRCYCFGCESGPNPFWWAAGWRLSPLVTGIALEEVIKIFTRHGFTWAGATDKKLVRDLYYL
jgi:hypothetical protein